MILQTCVWGYSHLGPGDPEIINFLFPSVNFFCFDPIVIAVRVLGVLQPASGDPRNAHLGLRAALL